MSYADSLLSTGERITHRVRQHWLTLLWGARIPIVAILAALLLLILSRNVEGAAQTLLGWLTLVLFVGGLAFLAWATMRYLNTEFVLTNRRVIQVEGVVNKRATDSSLEKINDAVLTQSLFGRMFGFGDLDVLTAAEAGIERFRMIIDPIGFKRAMLDAKHEYEVDMERSGWQPSPPIRAAASMSGPAVSAGAAGAGPAVPKAGTPVAAHPGSSGFTATPASSGFTGTPASGAPVSAAAQKVNPDEVTRTLSSLADLRDRGAISAEEFEAKKTDLLSRL
jgi:PH (Pleckstrin Homology) domain-containing protein/putative oligomerization/nucleic acid binding protein